MNDLENYNENTTEHLESIQWLLTTVDLTIDIIFYSGAIFSLLLTICLINNFVARKNLTLCTAYFYLLVIGYIINFFTVILYVLKEYVDPEESSILIIEINNLIQWYAKLFVGFWNSILVLNRFTALLFWNKQEKIWSGKSLGFIIFLMLAYPFIINGYSWADIYCTLNTYEDDCTEFMSNSRNFIAIANGANAIVALIFGLITSFSGRVSHLSKNGKTNNNSQKFEKRLLIQSIISSLIFGTYCALTAVYSILYPYQNHIEYAVYFDFARDFCNLLYMIFHYSSVILLVIVSSVEQNPWNSHITNVTTTPLQFHKIISTITSFGAETLTKIIIALALAVI